MNKLALLVVALSLAGCDKHFERWETEYGLCDKVIYAAINSGDNDTRYSNPYVKSEKPDYSIANNVLEKSTGEFRNQDVLGILQDYVRDGYEIGKMVDKTPVEMSRMADPKVQSCANKVSRAEKY